MAHKIRVQTRVILALVTTAVLLILSILVAHLYYWHWLFKKDGLCTYDLLIRSSQLTDIYNVYAITHVSISGLIDVTIAIMTGITISVLNVHMKRSQDKAFKGEICQIKYIFWTFFAAYAASFTYNLVMVIHPQWLSGRSRF